MTTETRKSENRKSSPALKRKRKKGVPVLLVILLLIIALLVGGLAGFAIARSTDDGNSELQAARDRIIELENTLTLIGFSTEDDTTDAFIFDNQGATDGLEDLSGFGGEDTSDGWESFGGWDDETVLEGTLSEPEAPVVVAEFNGGTLLSSEVIPEYNDQLTTQIFAGYAADEIADDLLQEVLSYMVSDKIIAVKAAEQGLDTLTNEDLSAISMEASDIYNEMVSYYTAFVAEEGMTDAEITEAAKAYLESEEGSTLDSITQELKDTWWAQKFYDYTVKDVTVTDAEVQAQYNAILENQRSTFETYPEEYEYAAHTGETILYNPEGYRTVQHILIPFTSEDDEAAATDLMDQIAQLDPISDAETIQAYQQQLDAIYQPLEATAQELLVKLSAGEDFDDLMRVYSADTESLTEPLSKTGYTISANTQMWSSEFIEGAMMLEKVGDISEPLRSASGVHIVCYAGDVTPGAVSITQVYDAIKAETLEIKQSDYYDAQCDAWIAEANTKFYPERLQ